MKKRYNNIFQYYGSENLENNLTKSFQNVLNNIDKKTQIELINKLFKKKLNENNKIKIILQTALSGDKKTDQEKSIIDVLILGESKSKKFSIGIEAKLDSKPNFNQLNKEWEHLKTDYENPELYLLAPKEKIESFKQKNKKIKSMSWEDTYNTFETIKNKQKKNKKKSKNKEETKTYFLLDTYLQNLRWLNMTGKLTNEFFQEIYEDRLENPKKTTEGERELFQKLIKEIQKKINEKKGMKLKEKPQTNYRGWFALTNYDNKEFQKHPHITFYIDERGLFVSANIEGTDKSDIITKLIKCKNLDNKIDEIIKKNNKDYKYEFSFTEQYSTYRKNPENIFSFNMKLNFSDKRGGDKKIDSVIASRKDRWKMFYDIYSKSLNAQKEGTEKKELYNFSKHYNKFRFSCFVPTKEICDEKNINIKKQAQLIVEKSKEIIDIFIIMESLDKKLNSKTKTNKISS